MLTAAVRAAERFAERRIHLILAGKDYQERFHRTHPVVPNTTYVPLRPPEPPGEDRVVYLGHLSADRGTGDMIEVARLLQPLGITVERHGCGFVVPFGDHAAAADAVLRLRNDPKLRSEMSQRGHRAALETLDWPVSAKTFVAQLEEWADQRSTRPAPIP